MTEATQHSYTPIEGFKQDDSKIIIIIFRHHSVKNEAVLVHAQTSRNSKIAGTGSLSLYSLRSGSHLTLELVAGKVAKFHFHSITAKGQFPNHTFRFGMHILRYRSLKLNGTISSISVKAREDLKNILRDKI